jgi:hypothetical protein
MSPTSAPSRPELAERLFASRWFKVVWIAVLVALLVRLWWVHDAVLVRWRYGHDAYSRQGIRVLPGKPARFSTGELVPQGMELVVGFAYFIAVAFGSSVLLVIVLRACERWRRSR